VPIAETAVLVAAAFVAGAMNAVAGGGSFLTLPALVYAGVPPVAANATGTAALLPGYASSAYGFRRDIRPVAGIGVGRLAAAGFTHELGRPLIEGRSACSPFTTTEGERHDGRFGGVLRRAHRSA
jgi:uncharacterized membrane protein YfcA